MLQTESGTHRLVFLIGSVVIKIPRWLRSKKKGSLRRLFKRVEFRKFLMWIRYDFKFVFQVFIDGFVENWTEWRCWRATRAEFLTPVYFSLGFINIQKRCRGAKITQDEDWEISARILKATEGDVWETNSHTFLSRGNYLRVGDGYKMIDFGDRTKDRMPVTDFIRKWHDELAEILSATY